MGGRKAIHFINQGFDVKNRYTLKQFSLPLAVSVAM